MDKIKSFFKKDRDAWFLTHTSTDSLASDKQMFNECCLEKRMKSIKNPQHL